jgi:hypothetical protein
MSWEWEVMEKEPGGGDMVDCLLDGWMDGIKGFER